MLIRIGQAPEEYAGVKTEEVLFTNGSDQGRIFVGSVSRFLG